MAFFSKVELSLLSVLIFFIFSVVLLRKEDVLSLVLGAFVTFSAVFFLYLNCVLTISSLNLINHINELHYFNIAALFGALGCFLGVVALLPIKYFQEKTRGK